MTAGPADRSRLLPWQVATILFAVAGAAAWGTAVERAATTAGFPLDDSWIHLQFARNLAEGQGFSFNPGVPSSGSTAPLWTILLAVPLAAGIPALLAAKALGIALTGVSAVAAAALTVRLSGSRGGALVAGLAVAVSPRVAWSALSGMEVPLYTALTMLAVLAYIDAVESGRGARWALWAGLAVWARPETLVAGAVLSVAWMAGAGRDLRTRRLRTGWWQPPAIVATLVAGFFAFNVWVGGRPLPNTFYAKHYGMGTAASIGEGRYADALLDLARYPVNLVGDLVWWLASHGGLLFGAALPGALLLLGLAGAARRGAWTVLAVVIATPLAKGVMAPQPIMLVHDGRYVLHLLVLALVVCACGVVLLARIVSRPWIVWALAAAGLVQMGGATYSAMTTYAAEVRNINDLQVRTGRWLAAHTAPDARVATNDIGAIAFFSRRFVLDTEGLVTPDAIWDKRMWRIDRFLERSRPDLVVIFPEWYPYLAQRATYLDEVSRISATKVIAGGESLVIYRTPWTRPGRFID
jgi:hypothetical protein